MMMREMLSHLGSSIASLLFVFAMFQEHFPIPFKGYFQRYTQKLISFMYPYIQITFDEFTDGWMRSEAFSTIRTYLSAKSTACAKRLKANAVKGNQPIVFSMDFNEEVVDVFQGAKVWWSCCKLVPISNKVSFSYYPSSDDSKYYRLTFHKRHRELITGSYIAHVMKEGKEIAARNRQRKLYCNTPSQNWSSYMKNKWSHVVFEHPATFETLAMEVKKKEEIKKDLIKFSKGKQYYSTIGKAWKRGYLLYGPPGTGKSTMIAAMANFLNYDVYDLELTAVKDNTELRRLLIETDNKSIIVIEDIDCSLDLTGQRKKKEDEDEDEDEDEGEGADPAKSVKKKVKEEEKKAKDSKVTLSGLLNFIDGLWSACGEERIIIFTTNYVDKLDPALIRRGRMDKHIEMSYCCFEAFKVLAKNYLSVESHPLFEEISGLLGETEITPADVAENLMLKSEDADEETCLKALIDALMAAKEKARLDAEEEARKKEEKEKKAKQEALLKKEQEEKEKEAKEEAHLKKKWEEKEKEQSGNGSGGTQVKEKDRLNAEEEASKVVEKEKNEKEEVLQKAEHEDKEKEQSGNGSEGMQDKEKGRLNAEEEARKVVEEEKNEKEEALPKAEDEDKEKEQSGNGSEGMQDKEKGRLNAEEEARKVVKEEKNEKEEALPKAEDEDKEKEQSAQP